MNTGSVGTSGVTRDAATMVAVPVNETAPQKTMGSTQPAQHSQPAQATGVDADVSPAQVKQIAAAMQKQVDGMHISLQYSLYGKHDRNIAVKVVNKETGEVIREIPPKELQALQEKMSELVGMIFNGKA